MNRHLRTALLSIWVSIPALLLSQNKPEPPLIHDKYNALYAICQNDFSQIDEKVAGIIDYNEPFGVWKYKVHPYVMGGRCKCFLSYFQEGLADLRLADSLLYAYRDSLGDDFDRVLATWLISEGYCQASLGDNIKALEAYQRSIAIYEKREKELGLNDSEWGFLRQLYLSCGRIYESEGALGKAMQTYTYVSNHPRDSDLGLVYLYMGDISLKQEKYQLAEEYYLKALALNEEVLTDPDPTENLFNRYIRTCLALAKLYRVQPQEDLAQSLRFVELAKKLANTGGYGMEGDLYEASALYYAAAGDIEASRAAYQQRLQFEGKSLPADAPEIGRIYYQMGRMYAKSGGQSCSALDYYRQAIQVFATRSTKLEDQGTFMPISPNERRLLLLTLMGKTEVLLECEPDSLQLAWKTIQWAHQLIDSLKLGYSYGEDKLALTKDSYRAYELGLTILAKKQAREVVPNSMQMAFQIMESSKSLLLLESLKKAEALEAGVIPRPLVEAERSIKLNLSLLAQKIADAQDDPKQAKELTQWNQQQFDLRNHYLKVLDSIKAYSQPYFNLRYREQESLGITQVQKLLAQDQALLEYFVGEEGIYTLIVTRDQVGLKRVPLGDSLIDHVLALRNILNSSPPSPTTQSAAWEASYQTFTQTSYTLYQTLLGDWFKSLRKKRVTLIPDGVLTYIPFDVLINRLPEAGKVSYRADHIPYLINDYQFTYAYSASILFQQQQAIQPPPPSTALFAGFAPQYRGPAYLTSRTRKLVARDQLEQLAFLKYNADEVQKIGALLPAQDNQLFIDSTATKAKFRELAVQARILHFAMHSFLNDSTPLFSGLVFQQPDGVIEEDGILFAYELMNMELKSELAVLSMCGSESGTYQPGQGLMSLARAFAFARCPSLVGSLWSVPDYSTSEIMVAFYRELVKGKEKDEALRVAKQWYLKQGYLYEELYHPNNWAPFIHIGDPKPISIFSWWHRHRLTVILLGVSLLVLVGYVRWRYFRQKSVRTVRI